MFLINEIHKTTINNKTLIINLINGAADLIDSKIYNKLINADYKSIDTKIISLLKDRKYLFNSEIEYSKFRKRLDSLINISELQSPPNFLIIPTYACNLSCTYCYQKSYEINHKKHFKVINSITNKQFEVIDKQFEYIEKIVKQKRENNKNIHNNDILITLMGGEPLLKSNSENIYYILDKIKSNNYLLEIITNGVELDYYLNNLKELNLENIQITLDGSKEIHDKRRLFRNGKGSFDRIITNIKKALSNNIKIDLRVNVDSENIYDLPRLANILLEEFGNNELLTPYIYLLQRYGKSCLGNSKVLSEKIAIKEIFKLEEKNPEIKIFDKQFHPSYFLNSIFSNEMFQPSLRHCSASSNQYILDYKGNVYKCWYGIGKDNYSVDSFIKNNTSNSSLLDSWMNRNNNTIEQCYDCKYRYICGTGCPAGNFDLNIPYCIEYKELIDVCVKKQLQAM